MRNIACIIARTNSTRFPKKVLKNVNGISLIEYIIKKIKRSKFIDEIYLCTSIDENDKVLLDIAKKNGIKGYAGSRDSVIDRMLDVAKIEKADNVIRITGDNIFTDQIYLDLMLKYHKKNSMEYTRTEYLPAGVTSEVISIKALKKCYSQMSPNESQYLLLYMFQPDKFKCQVLIPEKKHNRPTLTLTVDTIADFERTLQLTKNKKILLNIDNIIDICNANIIDNIEYKAGDSIKFPANLMISFEAFRTEIKMRVEKSHKVLLKKNEFYQMLKQQNNV